MKSFLNTMLGATCASLLGLSGCTFCAHGESGAQTRSAHAAGGERTVRRPATQTGAHGPGNVVGAAPSGTAAAGAPSPAGGSAGSTIVTPRPETPKAPITATGPVAGVGTIATPPQPQPDSPVAPIDSTEIWKGGKITPSPVAPKPGKKTTPVDLSGVVGVGTLMTRPGPGPVAAVDGKGTPKPERTKSHAKPVIDATHVGANGALLDPDSKIDTSGQEKPRKATKKESGADKRPARGVLPLPPVEQQVRPSKIRLPPSPATLPALAP